MQRIGILGVGKYLPPATRKNDWWPADVVARWPVARSGGAPPEGLSPSAQAIIAAMRDQSADPFQGSLVRHVIDDGTKLVEIEALAARDAMERAGVSTDDVDLVLTCSTPTEYQLTNSACALHEALGLPREAFAVNLDGAQHALFLQLTLARSMILAGTARCALLVQSSAVSRLLDPADPISPMFGDGATAMVVGPVAANKGILAITHRTDGRLPNTLVASVPGGRWYDPGRSVLHMTDPAGMRDILLRTVDLSCESIAAALARSEHRPEDVDVFIMHQGMPWLRRLVQDHAGLGHARSLDTFGATAHMFGAFLPSTIVAARDQGILGDGDLVVLAGGGNGMSYGAAVVRWGR